jgi:hypothetical protein
MSRGGQEVMSERPLELIRQAVIRDGHRCSICGRPCSEEEARRHSEPGAFGDSSMNFAAMCYGCQTWLAHEGARPAQYITHIYDRSEVRLRLRKIMDDGLAALIIGTYLVYSIFAAYIMYLTPHNAFSVLASGITIFGLIYLGISILDGIRRGRANRQATKRANCFDGQALHMDNQR